MLACEPPTENPPPVRAGADLTAPTLIFSASRPDFVARFPDLPLEDFEAGRVAAGDVTACPGPLDETNDDQCFAPGEIKPGIRFNGVASSEMGFELGLVGAGFGGVDHSKQLIAGFPTDTFVVVSPPPSPRRAWTWSRISPTTSVRSTSSALTTCCSAPPRPCNPAGTFWGVVSSDPITRIKIFSPPDQFEGVDNISFGTANLPPVATAGGPYSGLEGSRVDFDGSASFDPEGGSITCSWDWGDGTIPTAGLRPGHTYADNGSYTVTLTVSDGSLTGTTSTTAVIANVAPSVGPITGLPIDPVEVGTPLTASATFTDPGTSDTHIALFDWDDGTPPTGVVTESNGSGVASSLHTYTAAGVYTVTLTVTDNDGGTQQSRFEFVVVFDPVAGFVTGGGWIDSPAGAYTVAPGLSGKATFGFVSKYHKGTTEPSGSTEFHFHAAGLNFQSTEYDWLVVSGTKVQFKGSGTINGVGGFTFLVTAVDATGKPKGGDTFRIKIWNSATGVVIYDNNTSPLGGGSIEIHF
jgi:PKD repeat protein